MRYDAWYQKNREGVLAYQAAYREANPEWKRESDRAYREANREAIAARKRANYLRDRDAALAKGAAYRADNADAHRERARLYYWAHREAVSEYNRQRRERNRDAIADYLREWSQANPDKRRIANARRHAAKVSRTVEVFTSAQLAAHYAAMGYAGCVYCNGPHEHDDHIVPLSRGGAHSLDNLAPACASCNTSKGSKYLAEWLGFAHRKVAMS